MSQTSELSLSDQAISLCAAIAQTSPDDLDHLETLYATLDPLLDQANEDDVALIMASAIFQDNKDTLHAMRARYEYDREVLLADDIIAAHNAAVADQFRSHDWYDKALDFETTALKPYGCQRILFVGSGPFPTSPMAFLRNNPGAAVTCMERYEDACARARKVADIFGLPDLEIRNEDGAEITDFSDYDCVIVGLVVGAVDEQKSGVVDHFLTHVPDETLLCFRTADGSGRVIYPSVAPDHLVNVPHIVLKGPPHKSFTMIIVDRRS